MSRLIAVGRTLTRVERYDTRGFHVASDLDLRRLLAAGVLDAPDVSEHEGNLLMYGGASCGAEFMLGNGTGTAGQNLTYFNNANTYIGIGDSTTAAVATQTDLQASSNKVRIAVNATYPQHTDGVTAGAASTIYQVTAGSAVANFVWNEWGIFNGASGGRMLNRKQESLGTKSSGTWVFTTTLTPA